MKIIKQQCDHPLFHSSRLSFLPSIFHPSPVLLPSSYSLSARKLIKCFICRCISSWSISGNLTHLMARWGISILVDSVSLAEKALLKVCDIKHSDTLLPFWNSGTPAIYTAHCQLLFPWWARFSFWTLTKIPAFQVSLSFLSWLDSIHNVQSLNLSKSSRTFLSTRSSILITSRCLLLSVTNREACIAK